MIVNPPVVLGLWPIAGITTIGVTAADADETIRVAIEAGIRTFDTAFSYGYAGESDRYVGDAIRTTRDEFRVIGKVGQRWTDDRQRVVDASPRQLTADAEQSLKRMGVDYFDLLMLHSPDPSIPIGHSAAAMDELRRRGLCREVGVCNVDSNTLRQFCDAAECRAIQCGLNLLQPEHLSDLIPAASDLGCDVHVYWTLMKGLLAGKITRDHVFVTGDSRPNYDVFQGDRRERAHCVIDRLDRIAAEQQTTTARLAIGWVLCQPGVTAALVGARRPSQILETATSSPLSPAVLAEVTNAVTQVDDSSD